MLGVQLVGNLEHLGAAIMSDQIDQMLGLKTWAIVGLSNNSERAAYRVAKVLIENIFGNITISIFANKNLPRF